jgi:hypothetical protein
MSVDDERIADSAPAPQPEPTRDSIGTLTEPDAMLDVCGRERALVMRTRERYTAVQQLLAQGASLAEICRKLELGRGTVRRFARANTLDELLVKAVNRASVLDGYTQHLDARFAAGVTNAAILHGELTALGFTGSVQTIRRWLHPVKPRV